jgi:hypothetical protein
MLADWFIQQLGAVEFYICSCLEAMRRGIASKFLADVEINL